MKKRLSGILSLLIATVIWGSAFVAQSAGMDFIGPYTFQAIRSFLATVSLAVVILLAEHKNLKEHTSKWKSKKLWLSGGACGLALFVAAGMQQVGLVYTDAGKAGFITAMYIVIVPLLGLFLRRKPGIMAILGVVSAVAGLYFLSCFGVTKVNIGDIYLMIGAVAFAVQIILVDRLGGDMDSLRLNAVQCLVCAVLSSVVMLFTEEPQLRYILPCWFPLVYCGVVSMGFAYSLQIIGQKHLDPTPASMIMSLESVFAVLFASVILKESMTVWETVGSILVFAGVILSQLPAKSKASS